MIRGIVFDSQTFDNGFADKARRSGVRIAVISKDGQGCGYDACVNENALERKSELYLLASYKLGLSAEECVLFTSSEDGHRAAREARMFSFGIGGNEEEQIYSGCDAVLSDFEGFPSFNDVKSFSMAADSVKRDFCERTVIGKLLGVAKEAMKNAYAPFSKFHVGAAILTDKGNIYRGCNVENASLGGTICAERGAAMASIASEGASRFRLIAIASKAEDPAPPCAICRQFLAQFMPPDSQVYLVSSKNGVLRHYNFGTLMPYAFTEF